MKTYSGRGVAKVLWAVDPFHEKPREQLRSFEVVTKIFGKVPVSVQPVSMISLGRYDVGSKHFQEKWHDVATAAHKALEGLCSPIKHPGLKAPHLIRQEGSSISSSASDFLKYAVEEGANLLVVSSHARKGIGRFLIGSFAESLALHSPLPVLVVNPQSKAKSAPRLKTILFPTDFSPLSYKAFQRTVSLSALTGLSIMLFHKVQYLHPEIGPAFVYPAVDAESLKELKDCYRKEGMKWAEYAKQHGVKTTFHLDTNTGRALDEILRAAKKLGNTALIAMASQSGPAGASLLGSLTRKVLREAPCPIMVIHPEHESRVKEFVDTLKLAGYQYTAKPAFF